MGHPQVIAHEKGCVLSRVRVRVNYCVGTFLGELGRAWETLLPHL